VRAGLPILRSRLGQHYRPGRKQCGRGEKSSSQNFRNTFASRRMKARGIDHDDAPCCKPVMDMEVDRLSNGATELKVALSRKVDRAPASYSELKHERAWLVMVENFASK
jgi:hypothetical protein